MSIKDKLELGLKPDAPYRPDNLPERQQDDPACQEGAEEGEAAEVEAAREARADGRAEKPAEKPAAGPRARRSA
jgi:hypothetical protein